MPQLDLFSYFSVATTLILGFLFLVFVLHTYFLPKIAAALKFRKKIQQKQQGEKELVTNKVEEKGYEALLTMGQLYVNEMEKIIKNFYIGPCF